eukprot:g38069.t1
MNRTLTYPDVIQMFQGLGQGQGNGVRCGPVSPVGNLQGIKAGWETRVDVGHDQPFKALYDCRGQSHWAVAVEAHCMCFVWCWDDGGLSEADRDFKLKQAEVGDASEYPYQLVCTESKFTVGTPSGPIAFLGLTLGKAELMSAVVTEGSGSSGTVRA